MRSICHHLQSNQPSDYKGLFVIYGNSLTIYGIFKWSANDMYLTVYFFIAQIDKPWKIDHKIKRTIIINEVIDSNHEQYTQGPGGEIHKEVGCFCSSGSLNIEGMYSYNQNKLMKFLKMHRCWIFYQTFFFFLQKQHEK